MGMKPVCALALAVLVGALLAPAQQPSKEAKIEQLLSAMNADATVNQILDQIKTMAASQIPAGATPEQAAKAQETQARILDLVRSRISWEKMRPEYVKMYSEIFSDEEISGMLAFYQSPAGRGMLQKMPLVIKQSLEIAQARMAELSPEIERIVRESLPK